MPLENRSVPSPAEHKDECKAFAQPTPTSHMMQLQTRSPEVQGRTLEAVSSIQTSILPSFLGTPETPNLLVWPGNPRGQGAHGQVLVG